VISAVDRLTDRAGAGMIGTKPPVEVHVPFSDPRATATPWARARRVLEKAEVFSLSTVRRDGRPHVTPRVAVWLDRGAVLLYGPPRTQGQQPRARHPIHDRSQRRPDGLDVIVEGEAADEPRLRRPADIWERKYCFWHFEVRDGAFHHEAGRALVFQLAPTKAFSY
jgi:Pyridoxamine 5'-phosphate oxidase